MRPKDFQRLCNAPRGSGYPETVRDRQVMVPLLQLSTLHDHDILKVFSQAIFI